MSIQKDLPELVSANIISQDTAQQITDFYKRKLETAPNRQLFIFGILGALLVGIGVMFIVANQWDDLSQTVKTTCAFLLLIVPQLLCGYVLLSKREKIIWRESTALLLFFAVGANISLISQIYNINGETSSFILTWMLLTVPLIYLLNSSAVSLAYYFGIMFYCFASRYDSTDPSGQYLYWVLFILPLPLYYQQFTKSPESPLFTLHHWIIPYILTQTLGTLAHESKTLMYPAYIMLFGIFYFIGNNPFFRNRSHIHNGYRLFGFLGTLIVLIVMTFKTNWKGLTEQHYLINNLIISPEFIACTILFSLASILLYRQNRDKPLSDWILLDVMYLLFLIVFILGIWLTTLSIILINLLVLILGLLFIKSGSEKSHLGILNTGMFVIALLVISRSFDSDLTFVVKGTLFVLVGIGFFAANWFMIKKRK